MNNTQIIETYKQDIEKAVNNGDTQEVLLLTVIIVENACREQKAKFQSMAFDFANDIVNDNSHRVDRF